MGVGRALFNLLRNLFALIGVVACLVGIIGFKLVLDRYQLTPQQFAVKLARKAGVDSPFVIDLLSPEPKHARHVLTGGFFAERHPRILFAGQADFEKLRSRYKTDAAYRRSVDALANASSYMLKAVAWACSGDSAIGKDAVRKMQGLQVSSASPEGSYGNGLDIALAYDLLADHPAWTPVQRQQIAVKLRQFVRDSLIVLDGDAASLWHGRTQLASSVWVAAAVLDPEVGSERELITRAQAHFLESVEAVILTEGWPEGYNYWINNRAFPFAVACLAHLNAVDAPALNLRIRSALERIGLWTIQGTEPQGRFHLFGDSGPRNDLKDETQRVIDLIFMGTGNPVFKEYSEYLSALHGQEAYYISYRWGVPLLRGLIEDFNPPTSPVLSDLQNRLPLADMFGRNAFGQAFMRSDWGSEATFISYRAGHSFTHHGHYQAGHFTISQSGEPLAVTSGTYGEWVSPHRLHYYLRSVAANTLLVLRPGEKVRPNRLFDRNVSGGGQRIVMPTGSSVLSLADWRANLGQRQHYEGGGIKAFAHDHRFTFIASDLTGAYNNSRYDDNDRGGKVTQVTRDLLYLREEDTLLVHDRVAATDGGYVKKWLLHSLRKPQSEHEQILVGRPENGILESRDELMTIPATSTSLAVRKLLPRNGVVRKIGGPDYRYYVETDGDEKTLDGKNMIAGANEQPWFDAGMWRLEIQPEAGRKADRFLVLLKPGKAAADDLRRAQLLETDAGDGLETPHSLILFVTDQPQAGIEYLANPGKRLHILTGLPPDRAFRVAHAGKSFKVTSSAEGVLSFDLNAAALGRVRVRSL